MSPAITSLSVPSPPMQAMVSYLSAYCAANSVASPEASEITGRVFNAKDYTENYADTHQPGQTTARSTLS